MKKIQIDTEHFTTYTDVNEYFKSQIGTKYKHNLVITGDYKNNIYKVNINWQEYEERLEDNYDHLDMINKSIESFLTLDEIILKVKGGLINKYKQI